MNRPIRLVLDPTAVRAYPNFDIGETITQVEENGGGFTAPWPVLVACRDVDRRWLRLLTGHPTFEPCDIPADAWPQLSAAADVFGSVEHAAVYWVSARWRCDILTSDPKAYAPLGDDPPVIVF